MPTTLEMQGAVKIRELARLYLPRALNERELIKLFPMTNVNETELIYERRQVMTGLQNARGLGGQPGPVKKEGVDQFRVAPGYYGDYYQVDERELINLREAGKWDSFENYEAQAARGTTRLTQRFLDRVEYSIAQTITTGGFTANDARGREVTRDIFNVPSYTPSTLFSDLSNSTPLNYFRDLIPTLELGKSVSFQKGFILCSRPSANMILKNQNAADLNGRRLQYGQTVNNIEDFNKLLISNDLPPLLVYDAGYYSDPPGSAPTFNRFIANGYYVLVGRRTDGEQLGEYRMTRAAQNDGGAPGEWYQVEDRRSKSVPEVLMRMGHNGGPVPFYTEGFATVAGYSE